METKPRFKNSFGVTGTKGEIAHFKELADSIGWIKDSTLCNKSLVWFESSLSKISSLSGKYWSPIELKSPISLSTPEGWQRALSLAEEKEEEVSVYEVGEIIYWMGRHKTFARIHKANSPNKRGEICYHLDIFGCTTSHDDCHYSNIRYTTPEEKEKYIRQELLEEAKRRYPVGTKVKSLSYPGGIVDIIKSYKTDFSDTRQIWFEGDDFNIKVYCNGAWAEVVTEEKAPTKEEIERVLNYLQKSFNRG